MSPCTCPPLRGRPSLSPGCFQRAVLNGRRNMPGMWPGLSLSTMSSLDLSFSLVLACFLLLNKGGGLLRTMKMFGWHLWGGRTLPCLNSGVACCRISSIAPAMKHISGFASQTRGDSAVLWASCSLSPVPASPPSVQEADAEGRWAQGISVGTGAFLFFGIERLQLGAPGNKI